MGALVTNDLTNDSVPLDRCATRRTGGYDITRHGIVLVPVKGQSCFNSLVQQNQDICARARSSIN